ncbi:MAG: non-specific serine/threonine protein kinase [Candidatus Promineifilaceae bacterium]|jgi:non-specific serine/threonine protein kinase
MSKLLAFVAAEDIQKKVPDAVYQQSQTYYHDGLVELTDIDDEHAQLHVQEGDRTHYVNFEVFLDNLDSKCNCAAFGKKGICEHIVASHLFLTNFAVEQAGAPKRVLKRTLKLEKLEIPQTTQELEKPKEPEEPEGLQNNYAWRNRLDTILTPPELPSKYNRPLSSSQPYFIFFSLQKFFHTQNLVAYKINASLLPDSIYDVRSKKLLGSKEDVDRFIREGLPNLNRQSQIGNQTQLELKACLNLSLMLVKMINLVKKESYHYDVNFISYMDDIIALGGEIYVGDPTEPFQKKLKTFQEPTDFVLNLSFQEGNLITTPEIQVGDLKYPFDEGGDIVEHLGQTWLRLDDLLFSIGDQLDQPALNTIATIGHLNLNRDEANFFIDNYLLAIMDVVKVTGDAIYWSDIEDPAPQKQLFLSDDPNNSKRLIVQLAFAYDGHSILFDEEYNDNVSKRDESRTTGLNFIRVKRNLEFEFGIAQQLSSPSSGLKKSAASNEMGVFTLRSNTKPIDFLLKKVPNLTAEGYEVFGEENLSSVRVNRNTPSMSLTVSSGIDWFDVQTLVMFGDIQVKLPELRRVLRKKERFIKLADGSIGEIPEDWVEKYKHLFNLGEQTNEGTRFGQYHLTLIDQLLGDADQVSLDATYEARLKKLKDFSGIKPVPLPDGFRGELRPYQKAGYDWLHFLQEFHFGGCLADDMGLGKTVQMLAFLASVCQENPGQAAALIVMPRSLLTNWEREAEKFTPNLKTHIHFGLDRDMGLFDQYDIIFTTYGTMRRDIEILRNYKFSTIVLDESQAIKSPAAQVSKAARLLVGERRFTMSGTPVENSTFELWSQFAFLNPGLLGRIDYFKREFGNPIEKKQDEETAQFLQGMVFPFILRRTKGQVAPDLPPRTDEIVYTDMEDAQRLFYNNIRDDYRAQILGVVENKGVQGARMKVLEGLLRLRQICNHPKLVNQTYDGGSAKMDYLLEHLTNLAVPAEDGKPHKALVFSQFVQMLKLLGPELKKRNLRFAYLDGSTTKRQEQIDAFQNDPDIPFFLISLKAGGVGLNLTAADYVIHIDPWWNPAVEMQATDRTHRIGQDKPVFVKKLITRNSIEEKILELQQRKQKLVDRLIATESSFFKDLTPEDIQVLFS